MAPICGARGGSTVNAAARSTATAGIACGAFATIAAISLMIRAAGSTGAGFDSTMGSTSGGTSKTSVAAARSAGAGFGSGSDEGDAGCSVGAANGESGISNFSTGAVSQLGGRAGGGAGGVEVPAGSVACAAGRGGGETGCGRGRFGGGAATSRRNTAFSAAWRAASGGSVVAVVGFEIMGIPLGGRRETRGIIAKPTLVARSESPGPTRSVAIRAADRRMAR